VIQVKINGKDCQIPTELSEISLGSYIEFQENHKSFIEKYNEGFFDLAIKDGYQAIAAVVEGFDADDADEIAIGAYSKDSKEGTLLHILYLINALITTYFPEPLNENGYKFSYDGKEWIVPILKLYDGTINPDLTFGQYIEAMETIRMCNSVEEKTSSVQFSEYLRVLASIVREYGSSREETVLSLRQRCDDMAKYFEKIDMKSGLDVFFFLNGTITI
jgi:hypothetical protein